MKMLAASGTFFFTCAAPCTSMSSSRSLPRANASRRNASRGAVVVAEDLGVFQELRPRRSCFSNSSRVMKKYSRPDLLAAARQTRGVADGKLQVGDDATQLRWSASICPSLRAPK